ncbi:MAG: hypothetical protein SFW62_01285 [Alphaproteobacteria bacterium]|nr:hypothetical protein [Alphaproteobacteria bacterium]
MVTPRHADDETTLNRERALCAEIVKSLKRAFTLIEGTEDDYMGGRVRPPREANAQPSGKRARSIGVKESGYEAIHCAFSLGGNAKFEVQIMGKSMYHNNEYGTAARTRYKHDWAATAAEVLEENTVSVFGPTGNIIRLPQGASVADCLASLGSNFAFLADDMTIKRYGHYYDSSVSPPGTGFSSPLVTGDHIHFAVNADLQHNSAHRARVIEACRLPEMRYVLERRHQELLDIEQNPAPVREDRPATVAEPAKAAL